MKRAVKFAALTCLLLGLGFGLPKERLKEGFAQVQHRPNIIFVFTDDQMPGTENRMPALQNNIVREGVTFSNTVSTYPLCCPGRATFQRGQYPHNTHIYGNEVPMGGWDEFQNQGLHHSTIATWLDASGYSTGQFGKYMNNYRDRGIPPGWDRWYAWDGPQQGWESVNDQGVHRDINPQNADTLVADHALTFMDTRLSSGKPFFAAVNFGAMHRPYYHARADNDNFIGERVPRTPAFNEDDVSDKPAVIRSLGKLSPAEVAEIDANYRNGLRSLMRVDRFIANATGMLRAHGEMDNTYFVFYTDNGNHFGQHRLVPGKLQPFKEDISFPLMMRGPGIPRGVSRDGLVGNHDIAPTLARMGGATVPGFVDGRSILGLAQGSLTNWSRTAILSQRSPLISEAHSWQALRMARSVYVTRPNGDREHYDLLHDPYQLHSNPDSVDQATRPYWERRLNDLHGCKGAGCRAAENAPLLQAGTAP